MISSLFSTTPSPAAQKAREWLAFGTELPLFLLLLPMGMAHNTAPRAFIAFLTAAMIWMSGGGGGGKGHHSIQTYMPAHIAARYDAAAWLIGPLLYATLRLTDASMGACLATFFFGVVPVTGAILHYNSNEYCWETKWARENPQQAAEKAAAAAAASAKWWAEAHATAANWTIAICITFSLFLSAIILVGTLLKSGEGIGPVAFIGLVAAITYVAIKGE
jgi:hypothetical protein